MFMSIIFSVRVKLNGARWGLRLDDISDWKNVVLVVIADGVVIAEEKDLFYFRLIEIIYIIH
jgi:hypothetical protein